jgi:hypothetical protein
MLSAGEKKARREYFPTSVSFPMCFLRSTGGADVPIGTLGKTFFFVYALKLFSARSAKSLGALCG